MSTSAQSDSEKCFICQKLRKGVKFCYGMLMCGGCKEFYHRYKDIITANSSCTAAGKKPCNLNNNRTRPCPECRFRKFVEAGVDPKNIGRGGSSTQNYKRKREQPRTELALTSQQTLGQENQQQPHGIIVLENVSQQQQQCSQNAYFDGDGTLVFTITGAFPRNIKLVDAIQHRTLELQIQGNGINNIQYYQQHLGVDLHEQQITTAMDQLSLPLVTDQLPIATQIYPNPSHQMTAQQLTENLDVEAGRGLFIWQ